MSVWKGISREQWVCWLARRGLLGHTLLFFLISPVSAMRHSPPSQKQGSLVCHKANLVCVLMVVKAFLLTIQSLSFVVLLFMLPSYLWFLKWNIPIISHSYFKSHDLLRRTIKLCCFVWVPAQDTNQCLCPGYTQYTHSCQSSLSYFLGYQIDWH